MKITQPMMEVKYSGVFDMDFFYSDIKLFFDERHLVFNEFVHKFKPPEMELTWKGERRDTDFKKTKITMFLHAWYMKEVDVEVHGKKRKMIDARVQVKIVGNHEVDYKGRFNSNKFTKFLFNFLIKYVLFYKVIIMDGDKVYYEMLELQKRVKNAFDMSLKKGAF